MPDVALTKPVQNRLRILSLEDDPHDAELVQAALRTSGMAFDFRRVSTEAEYVSAIEAGGFDLILADHALPEFDGITALRLCFERRPDVPFIFVSGSLGEDVAIETLKHGATDYVIKDRLDRLPSAIDRAFRESQERAARRSAEESLRISEEKFSKAFYASPDAVLIVRRSDGMLIEVNEGFEKLTGYPREEALHKTVLNLGIWVNPADRQILLDQMGEKGRADELEFRLRHKNREERIGVISARAIEFHGQPCMVVVGRDVTERKQMEEQLRQAQKMESVGHLAAGVAHDFNNLLTIILGNSSLLEEQLLNQPDLLDPLKDIILAAEKAVNLTRQLLMFSRRQVMQTRMLNLNEIIGDLSKLLARLLREDIDLEFSYARSLPLICGDAGMLEQVIMNLVVNARDAMPGVGKLRIATSAEEFDEKDVERRPNIRIGHFVCVSFQDNGCGICPENLQQIFEPFFTTKEAGKGTGLGLATVYGIVKQHQGWVEVQSQIGAGARFDVYLPVCSKESGSQTAEPIKLKSHVGTETILIVEDDPSILNITATTLKRAGYRTLEYRSGAEAWSSHASKADQIHLILTDLVIPGGINGLEMSAKFASINPAIRLIVTSGYSVEIAKWRMLEQNNVKFIPKPYKMDQVLKAVRDSLDHLAWIPSAP